MFQQSNDYTSIATPSFPSIPSTPSHSPLIITTQSSTLAPAQTPISTAQLGNARKGKHKKKKEYNANTSEEDIAIGKDDPKKKKRKQTRPKKLTMEHMH